MRKIQFDFLIFSIFPARPLILILLLAGGHLPFSICHSTNWLVGPTQTYTKPSQVAGLVQNGDTVSIDAGTYTADVAHWTAQNLLLRGVGNGFAHMDANNTAWGQKAIWVIGGNNAVVKNIEFSHCHDVAGASKNWAGIRQEGLNLTVSHCYFHDNDNGILAGTLNPSRIIIQFTEFNHNGYGDGFSHNLYINHVDTLVFRYNYSHHATVGHELKSRANVNYILYNRFSNESTGDASREIDLPNGGPAVILGNVIEQGPNSQNSGIVGYGLEGLSNPAPQELYFVNNTVVNDKSSGTFVAIQSGMSLYKAWNNIFAGSGTLLTGSASTIDTSKNWRVNNISNAGFVNAAGYDYHLTAFSPAINAGGIAGIANNGFNLTATQEYSHSAGTIAKTLSGVIDMGAYEFASATGFENVPSPEDQLQCWPGDGSIICATSLLSVQIKLFDLNGKLMTAQKMYQGVSSISVRNFPKGIYLIQASAGGQQFTQKILIR